MAIHNLTTASGLFKRKYVKLSERMYSAKNATTGRIKVRKDFTGSAIYQAVPLSFSGGVGSGSLPTAGVGTYSQANFQAKKVYAKTRVDRETIKASSSDEGAFVRLIKQSVQDCLESAQRNRSRILFGNGDGSLGTVDSVTGSNPYTLTIAAGYNEANFEEGDLVNIETGNTDPFLIDSVSPQSDGTLDVVVTRQSGSQAPTGTDEIFMQNSEDNDPIGLKQVCDATSSTLYGVTVGRRWQSTQKALSSTSISVDNMVEQCLEIHRKSGFHVDHIVTSYTQFRKLLALHEDLKTYECMPRYSDDKMKANKAKFSFSGLQLTTQGGNVGIFHDRFVDPDRMYFLKTGEVIEWQRPDFGWIDDFQGSVFMPDHNSSSSDSYSAYYGGYYQNYIKPTPQGVITGAAI